MFHVKHFSEKKQENFVKNKNQNPLQEFSDTLVKMDIQKILVIERSIYGLIKRLCVLRILGIRSGKLTNKNHLFII